MFDRGTNATQFPLYLLPSSPFGRRKADEKTSRHFYSDTVDAKSDVADVDEYFPGHGSHLRCARCATDVCFTTQIISKGFTGRHGRAYLVAPSTQKSSKSQGNPGNVAPGLPNTKTGHPSKRQLVTGVHTVSDVRCSFCSSVLGWKYEGAEEESQRYKVGKYILETKMVCSSSNWLHRDQAIWPASLQTASGIEQRAECCADIEFDSQDEEECEDLFAGVWSPALAFKRRQAKSFRKAVCPVEGRAT